MSTLKNIDFKNKRIVDYIHGVICGDGHITKYSTDIACGLDLGYADILSDIISSSFDVDCPIYEHNKLYNGELKTYYVVGVNSKVFCDYYYPLKYPKWNIDSIEFIDEFFSGIVDTDGSINCGMNGYWVLSIVQKGFENFSIILNIIKSSGVNTKKYGLIRDDTYNITIGHSDDILKISSHLNLRHPEKLKKLKIMIEQRNNTIILSHKGEIPNKIISFLGDKPEGLTAREIAEGIDFDFKKTFDHILRLIQDNRLISSGERGYRKYMLR